jgi:hypothetical protein
VVFPLLGNIRVVGSFLAWVRVVVGMVELHSQVSYWETDLCWFRNVWHELCVSVCVCGRWWAGWPDEFAKEWPKNVAQNISWFKNLG